MKFSTIVLVTMLLTICFACADQPAIDEPTPTDQATLSESSKELSSTQPVSPPLNDAQSVPSTDGRSTEAPASPTRRAESPTSSSNGSLEALAEFIPTDNQGFMLLDIEQARAGRVPPAVRDEFVNGLNELLVAFDMSASQVSTFAGVQIDGQDVFIVDGAFDFTPIRQALAELNYMRQDYYDYGIWGGGDVPGAAAVSLVVDRDVVLIGEDSSKPVQKVLNSLANSSGLLALDPDSAARKFVENSGQAWMVLVPVGEDCGGVGLHGCVAFSWTSSSTDESTVEVSWRYAFEPEANIASALADLVNIFNGIPQFEMGGVRSEELALIVTGFISQNDWDREAWTWHQRAAKVPTATAPVPPVLPPPDRVVRRGPEHFSQSSLPSGARPMAPHTPTAAPTPTAVPPPEGPLQEALWRFRMSSSAGEYVFASAGDFVYIAQATFNEYGNSVRNQLDALDLTTGQEIWTRSLPPSSIYVETRMSGLMWVYSISGVLSAYDRSNGKLHWQYPAETTTAGCDVNIEFADNTVYCHSRSEGKIEAINGIDGKRIWQYETGSSAHHRFAVAHGAVYVLTRDGYLYSLDAETGNLRWRFRTFRATSRIMADDVVYIYPIGSVSGPDRMPFYALNSDTGDVRWQFDLSDLGGEVLDALVSGDKVFLHGLSGNLIALDSRTGNQIWHFRVDNDVAGRLLLTDDKLIVARPTGAVGIDALMGTQLWDYETDSSRVLYMETTSDGVVLLGSISDGVIALDSNTGHLLWERNRPEVDWRFTFENGVVYVSAAETLFALDSNTGEVLWQHTSTDEIYGSQMVMGDVVLIVSSDRYLSALPTPSVQRE